ncbi:MULTISPECIES: aromatic ring-hydroxylating oxygenase subunit alpha [Streptomyces]|uniref:Aromatic ring-hydroxylating dioxygenase subunit alpha n=1 Tax=Streptomyces siderophoricus TaxID=2802281 RepID=A0ABS1N4M8_9ACTN|nr:aromatic ring-hydroxylating dioxygenase subunit alpha [Streptomyces sp. 9-7]MBL1095037.1 aromatic ring-hydroxylating dioxygenase subunit alpha [Streptomyces sp. 9-7]
MISWPSTHYTSQERFELERERIFEQSWICVGRSSAVSEAGSFLRAEVGRESVLVVRNRDGQLRGLVNLCRHRGVQLCMEESGNFGKSIRCPYHGWTFGLDGRLVAAPYINDLPPETRERHLYTAAVTEWLGYVWVNLNTEAPPLSEQVAPMLRHRFGEIDVPSHYGMEDLTVAKTISYDVRANWKILFENFCECYHCPTMHPEICDALPEWRSGYGTVAGPEGPKREGSKLADGATGFSLSGRAAAPTLPGVPREDERTFHGILLWPNVHLIFVPDHVMCMRFEPQGPDRTRVISDWLFHPEAIADPDFNPNDAVGLIDVTARQDFEACERVQLGTSSAYFEELHTPHESLILDFRSWIHQAIAERPVPRLTIGQSVNGDSNATTLTSTGTSSEVGV